MDLEEIKFWKVIEESSDIAEKTFTELSHSKTDLFYEKQANIIVDILLTLKIEDIYSYYRVFWINWSKSYTLNTYVILYILEYSVTNGDMFRNFRCWLIAQGKDFFYKAINAPDDLVGGLERDSAYVIESLFGIADEAFRKKNYPKGVDLDDLPSCQKLDLEQYLGHLKLMNNN